MDREQQRRIFDGCTGFGVVRLTVENHSCAEQLKSVFRLNASGHTIEIWMSFIIIIF